MQTVFKVTLLLLVASFGSGCASIMEGSDQVININTTGCEDSGVVVCTVRNSDGSSVITAPASTSVEKTRGALTIDCSSKDKLATGSLTVESGYEAMNAGNILLGGVSGLGVDAATGAMWKYPSAVVVPMKCPVN